MHEATKSKFVVIGTNMQTLPEEINEILSWNNGDGRQANATTQVN